MKEKRIQIIKECMKEIEEMLNFYKVYAPCWTLLYASKENMKTIYHLETETNFNDEHLGVRDDK